MEYDFDLFVIGAGSGGVRAARISAGFGAKVAICEDQFMGGTCVNVGCVPKKLYVYAAEYSKQVKNAKGFGWSTPPPSFDWNTLRNNKKTEVKRLNGIYESLLQTANVTVINGRGKITGPHTVEVNGKQYLCAKILIAVGGWPFVPNIPGSKYAVTSNEIFDLEKFPQNIVVIGGGYIAVEFAGIFNGLGASVTQLYRGDLFLRGFDEEIRQFAAQEIAKQGVNIRFNTDVAAIQKDATGNLQLTLTNGETINTQAVLFATGRKPNINTLCTPEANLALTTSGHIAVNHQFQTSIPSIYAVGDVIGGMELTPVALEEGMALAKHLFNHQPCELDYNNIATAVFCQPNIGTVGMTEEQARKKYPHLKKFRSEFRALKHTLSGSNERTLMKLLVDGATDKIVGAHMVGADAGEIVQGLAIAIKAGATKKIFDETIGIHPTAAEEFVTMRSPVKP